MTPSRDPDWDYRIPATFAALSDLLVRFGGELRDRAPEAGDPATWEIVLAEACNNVIEHAYEGQECGADDCLRLNLWLEDGALVAKLTDRGRSMPDGTLPAPRSRSEEELAATLPEGGFGWHLIKSLASSATYERAEDENHLRLTIPFADQAEDARK